MRPELVSHLLGSDMKSCGFPEERAGGVRFCFSGSSTRCFAQPSGEEDTSSLMRNNYLKGQTIEVEETPGRGVF